MSGESVSMLINAGNLKNKQDVKRKSVVRSSVITAAAPHNPGPIPASVQSVGSRRNEVLGHVMGQ